MQHDGDNRVVEFVGESWLADRKVNPKVPRASADHIQVALQSLAVVSRHRGKPSQCHRLREGEMTLVKQWANRLDRLRFEALEWKADTDRGGLVDYNGNRRWRWR